MLACLPTYQARRVISAETRGSSRPIVVETDAGYFFTKLHEAAQGAAALVAEIIVAALAEALGLWVPCHALITIDSTIENSLKEDEFLDLLHASYGVNLGFQYLPGARDIAPQDIDQLDTSFAAQVLWLDSLVMNRDRTRQNPNLMRDQNQYWLIDHGAALPFQYNWSIVTEAMPRRVQYSMQQHIFGAQAQHLAAWDETLSAKLTRETLQSAVSQVPDAFLKPLLGDHATAEHIERRRQAYAAFLWKRLKPPRLFAINLNPDWCSAA